MDSIHDWPEEIRAALLSNLDGLREEIDSIKPDSPDLSYRRLVNHWKLTRGRAEQADFQTLLAINDTLLMIYGFLELLRPGFVNQLEARTKSREARSQAADQRGRQLMEIYKAVRSECESDHDAHQAAAIKWNAEHPHDKPLSYKTVERAAKKFL